MSQNWILHLYATFCTILLLLSLPGIFLSFLPVYLFRWIVAKIIVPVFRSDLDKAVVSRNAILAVDNPYKSPNWNLCVWIVVEENLDFERFTENFYKNIVCKKLGNGKFADPEYQQYYTKFLGFLFWKWETKFSIREHMRVFESYPGSKSTSEKELKELVQRLAWAPFPKEKSPWEFLFVPNYVSETDENPNPKSVLIFRVHHGVCDGLVILRLLMQDLNGVSVEINASPNYIVKPWWKKTLDALTFPVRGPYQFCRMLLEGKDENEWHVHSQQGLANERENSASGFTKRIPLTLIREVKNNFGVSFNAVVIAIITAGIRKMMMHQGKRIPEDITAGVPCPMPQHPTKLRNHFVFAFLKLPVGIADPIQRLKKIEDNLKTLKSSLIPIFNWSMIPVLGSLFHWMMKPMNHNVYSTTIISNFPGPAGGKDVKEKGWFIADGGRHWITDMNFCAGGGSGHVGLGFCLLSYNDGMRIITEAARYIAKGDEEVNKLNDFIIEELKLLCSHSVV